MPKAVKKKPTQSATTVPTPPPPLEQIHAAVPVPQDRPIIYDKLELLEYSTASEKGPMTPAIWRRVLGWETEKEYQARMVKEKGGSPDNYQYLDDYHCLNVAGEKVRTSNNANNRSFDDKWCQSLIHTLLYGQWAGPITIPGETVNGETVRISKYARVISGQHQGTACILADEHLQYARAHDNPDKYPFWKGKDSVVLETVVIRGMSEDPRVLMTVDYCKPRSVADVFFTSELFRNTTNNRRKELCRMLAMASDMLWDRTDTRGYKTHPEMVAFVDRHPKLIECVTHIFEENGEGKRISKLRLSPGQCAALLYIMGSSGEKTDVDVYRNETPPSEANLDWEPWERAQEFWVLLGSDKGFAPVRRALGLLLESAADNDENLGLGGRLPEKLAILARAWERFKDHVDASGPPFTDEDLGEDGCLFLNYTNLDEKGDKLPDGRIDLVDIAEFYGIDAPEMVKSKTTKEKIQRTQPPDPAPPSPEEMEKLKEEALQRREANAKG